MHVSERHDSLYSTLLRVLLMAFALGLLVWFFYRIGTVLLASVLSLILAIAFNAAVEFLERRNVPRGAGTALTFLAAAAVFTVVVRLVVPQLAGQLPQLIDQIPELIEAIGDGISSLIGAQPEVERQLARLVDWSLGLLEGLWRHTGALLSALVMALFVVALVLYSVIYFRPILRWYIRSMPAHLRTPAERAFTRASKMVIGWFIASIILGGIKSVAAFIFLSLMQIPGAIVWSLMAFLGAFIPRVGFYFMTIPPVIVALGVGPMEALWTLGFYVAFSELLGNFVAPRIFAETMNLNAVYILIMTLALGYGFGLIGMLIATPVAGFIKAYYDEFYLVRQPEDPELEQRVEAMMRRRID